MRNIHEEASYRRRMQMVNNQEKMHNITSWVDKINQTASKVWGS